VDKSLFLKSSSFLSMLLLVEFGEDHNKSEIGTV
jgi:hypothetical protein